MAYDCTRCGMFHIGRAPEDHGPQPKPGIDHPYWEQLGSSPRQVCCAKPRDEHPA